MNTQTSVEKQRTHQILLKMKELFQENNWIRHSFAVDSQGMVIPPCKKDACGFCLLGSILRVTKNSETDYKTKNTGYYSVCYVLEEVLLERYGEPSITNWNDNTAKNKEEVIALIDKAIEKVTQ